MEPLRYEVTEWPDGQRDIETGIEKLAAYGSADQMRDHLVEQKIVGIRHNRQRCIVAEYLVLNGFVDREDIAVCETRTAGSHTEVDESARVVHLHNTGPIRHPAEMQALIRRFDAGQYPELVEP